MGWTSLTIGEVGAGILALAAAIGMWWKIVRPAAHFVRLVVGFLDDWNGSSEERDASGTIIRKAQPGWAARLASMEHELHPNRGSSIKDSVARTEAAVQRLDTKLTELAGVAAEDRRASSEAHRLIHDRIDRIKDRIDRIKDRS